MKKISISALLLTISLLISCGGNSSFTNSELNNSNSSLSEFTSNNTSDFISESFINDLIKLKGFNESDRYDIDFDKKLHTFIKNEAYSEAIDLIFDWFINSYFNMPKNISLLKNIENDSRNQINKIKKEIHQHANEMHVSFEELFFQYLQELNLKNEDELYKYIFEEKKKEYFLDQYFNQNINKYKSSYIGISDDGELTNDGLAKYPYHIRHILIRGNNFIHKNYEELSISNQEVNKLYTVSNLLADDRFTFGEVASRYSDDPSASQYGDAGIMDLSTNFINELKFGIYFTNLVYLKNHQGDPLLKDKAFNIDNDTKDKITNFGLKEIPYQVFKQLLDSKDKMDENDEKYIRNNIFNQYFGVRTPFIITNGSGDVSNTKRFRHIDGVKDNVLCDEDGRAIIGLTSEYGIHFVIIERSPFEVNYTMSENNDEINQISISEYYATLMPSDENFPKTSDGKNKVTFINSLNDDASAYSHRQEFLVNQIKGNLNQRILIFDYLNELIGTQNIMFLNDNYYKGYKTFERNVRNALKMETTTSLNQDLNKYILDIEKDISWNKHN